MTNQEVFNNVWQHFVVEGNPPCCEPKNLHIMGFCLYRKEGEKGCAIGINIPDKLYLPEMEGMAYCELVAHYPALSVLFAGCNQSVLSHLQRVHDRIAELCEREKAVSSRAEFERRLRHIAGVYNLEVPSTNGKKND